MHGAQALQPNPRRHLRAQPRPQRLVLAKVYRGYNEMMSKRTREYLHDGDEPVGDFLYDGELDEDEDEDALLDERLRVSEVVGKKLTIASLQRAYTGESLPQRFIGPVKLVATKSEHCCLALSSASQAPPIVLAMPVQHRIAAAPQAVIQLALALATQCCSCQAHACLPPPWQLHSIPASCSSCFTYSAPASEQGLAAVGISHADMLCSCPQARAGP